LIVVKQPFLKPYEEAHLKAIEETFEQLKKVANEQLQNSGFEKESIRLQEFLHLRYEGTDTALMIPKPPQGNYEDEFVKTYRHQYGFTTNRKIIVDNIRVRGTATASHIRKQTIPQQQGLAEPITTHRTYFRGHGRMDTPVFQLARLGAGARIAGPALIMDATNTIVLEPNCSAVITEGGDVLITVEGQAALASELQQSMAKEGTAIGVSILGHRFMSIAEQMGRILQRTAISVNIKERLDFSCAIFDVNTLLPPFFFFIFWLYAPPFCLSPSHPTSSLSFFFFFVVGEI
jgi:5-oxoprolinase (ATP-hydrolysing)